MQNYKHKKKFGQNFLKNDEIIDRIIEHSGANSDDYVIEIGPGLGALTSNLVKLVDKLTVIEIDSDLIESLEKIYSGDHYEIINQDFLTIDPNSLKEDSKRVLVIANLPYYITSPIVIKLITEYLFVDEIYIMIQKEVAERITSKTHSKSYGSMSVFCQVFMDVNYEFTVDRSEFDPSPNVDSSIISMKRKKKVNIPVYFEDFLRASFQQKRKLLANNLAQRYPFEKKIIKSFLLEKGYSENIRAEEISPSNFIELAIDFYRFFEIKELK